MINDNLSDIEGLRSLRAFLSVTRWVIIIGVLSADEFVKFQNVIVEKTHILVAVLAIAIATLAIQIAAARTKRVRSPILSTIADIALVTIVIYFSDGVQSPFYPLYYVTVITTAVSLGLWGALAAALAIAGLSLGVEAVQAASNSGTTPLLFNDIVRTVPYLFLVAAITGVLRLRLRVLSEATSTLRADRAAAEREMEVARRVQRAQLPVAVPRIEGLQIAVVYNPAREVGGDLYDFHLTEPRRLGITVADVAGKGVPAALLVSSAKYAVRENDSKPEAELMHDVNNHLLAITTDDTFVAMTHGILSLEAREFRYANAGQMPPIVVKPTGQVVLYAHADPPLGIMPGTTYSEHSIRLDPGDTLVLYTDGMTDALGSGGDGLAKFQQVLARLAPRSLADWKGELLDSAQRPCYLDDVTVVALRLE